MSLSSINVFSIPRNFMLFLCIIYISFSHVNAQVIWDKTYGGTSGDLGKVIIPAVDGDGFLIGGVSGSGSGNHKSAPHYGGADYWIVRIDAQGNRLWDKSYSGLNSGLNGRDWLECMIPTSDGGYLLGGWSKSDKGYHKSESPLYIYHHHSDIWIIKIDAQGNKLWDKTIGSSSGDLISDIIETADGGFLLAGISMSEGSDDDPLNDNLLFDKSELGGRGLTDYWIVKIDAQGNKVWDKIYGGSYYDNLQKCLATSDGNYLLVGHSSSNAGYEKSEDRFTSSVWDEDFWVLKIDPLGNKIWDNTIGGTDRDWSRDAINTPDGGYLIGGHSKSPKSGKKSQNNPTDSWAMWLIKLDADGNKIWDRTYDGDRDDHLSKIGLSQDNSILLVGYSKSDMGHDKTLNPKGGRGNNEYDIWIVKTDLQGNILGDMTIGGTKRDEAEDAFVFSEDSIMIVAYSKSPISYDKASPNLGGSDFWLLNVKFNKDAVYIVPPFSIDDWILTCRFCDIWGHPWEDIIDIEYRFWRTELGVEAATSRLAYSGSRTHRDVVYWENDTDLAIEFYPDLAAGEYQFQMRGKLSNRSYTEWTEPTTFEIAGSRVEAFPNPVRNTLNVVYQASRAEEVQVKVMDQMGQVLFSQSYHAIEGTNEWSLGLGRSCHGLLTLEISSDYHGPYTKRLLRE